MRKFIFDVDGTLTPSRRHIDSDFMIYMILFCCSYDVYLVTGSDRDKTIDQLGLDVCYRSKRVYNCSGSDAYEKEKNVYRDDWKLPNDVRLFLHKELGSSKFPVRNGVHIEERPGGVNFSILGRGGGVNLVEREEYVKWDINTNERKEILTRLKNEFPELEVQVGGQTGLDLAPKGRNKSQILRDFNDEDELHFFGDMMEEGQNDYPLAKAVKEWGGYPHAVKNWEDTRTQLSEFMI